MAKYIFTEVDFLGGKAVPLMFTDRELKLTY